MRSYFKHLFIYIFHRESSLNRKIVLHFCIHRKYGRISFSVKTLLLCQDMNKWFMPEYIGYNVADVMLNHVWNANVNSYLIFMEIPYLFLLSNRKCVFWRYKFCLDRGFSGIRTLRAIVYLYIDHMINIYKSVLVVVSYYNRNTI